MSDTIFPHEEHYEHNTECTGKIFGSTSDRGLKLCLECSGVFDEDGKGISVLDRRMTDERWTPPEEDE